ncbi:hypothetical protein HMPREF6123_0402 [Oribacterium sinus F0268]|uniref:Uncharacterized protein n=1 Tax=Oribacterium sinus F0268 TaxID=585501 RepID=C2KV83_9FIRM|nr:hypothetical protein HMPREF6123_0402 [Oribacterium sinus F0268]
MFFASTHGLRLPHIQAYIAENSLIILIFYSTFLVAFFIRFSKQKNYPPLFFSSDIFLYLFFFKPQEIIDNYSYVITIKFYCFLLKSL